MRHHDRDLNDLVESRFLKGLQDRRRRRLVERGLQPESRSKHVLRSAKACVELHGPWKIGRWAAHLRRTVIGSRASRLSAEDWLLYTNNGTDDGMLPFMLARKELVSCLKAGLDPEICERFDDKRAVSEACRQAGIPSPRILAWTEGRERYHCESDVDLPALEAGLFVKPLNGIRGGGAVRITNEGGEGFRWGADPELREWADLGKALLSHARDCEDDVIVQKCLESHPTVAKLTGDRLSTVRVVTCRIEGRPSVVLATLCCPGAGRSVDNFAQGGMAAPICVESGRISGPACQKRGRVGIEWHENHPDQGERFEGFAIPRWNEVLELVLRAHEHFRALIPSAGWDVAIQEEGPYLMEINPVWGADVVQLSNQRGLLDSPFATHVREEWAMTSAS